MLDHMLGRLVASADDEAYDGLHQDDLGPIRKQAATVRGNMLGALASLKVKAKNAAVAA